MNTYQEASVDFGGLLAGRHSLRARTELLVAAALLAAPVALAAVTFTEVGLLRAIGVGLVAVLLRFILRTFSRSPEWRRLGAASPIPATSPIEMLAVAAGLAMGYETFGVGLPIGAALAAVGAYAVISRTSVVLATRASREQRRVIIVGAGAVGRHVAERIGNQRGFDVVGFVDSDPPPQPEDGTPVRGALADLPDVVERFGVSIVVFAFSAQRDSETASALRVCRSLGVAVCVVPRMFEELDCRIAPRRIGGMQLLAVEPRFHHRYVPSVTRFVDLVAAAALLVLSAPVWILLALAIVIEVPGPVFYRARRVGFGGEHFAMLKFRKMRDDVAGPRITRADDDRFTKVGRFLARWKLDELPQLWNVVRGDMSLVGPRPEDPVYVGLHEREFAKILAVRPGITGLSQIQYRDEASLLLGADYEERYRNELLPAKMTIDMYYADRRTLALDFRILFWTAIAIVKGVQVERCDLTKRIEFIADGRSATPGGKY